MIDRKIQLPPKHSFFLFGPRQTGKSTLLRSIFKEKETSFYDLLKSDDYLRFVESPWILREEVLQQASKKRCVVIDEVQRIPELLNEVHHLIEAHPHKFQFALSGSSVRKLKREQANLLAGRAFVYHLYPLTHRELLSEFNLAKTLRFGSLPSVYLAQDPAEARQILKAYTETYLQQEIQLEAKVRNLGAFIRFLKIAADGQGNMVNYSNIAREAGISYQTVKEHYQILEDTLLGFYLYPYRKSLRARLAKHPKFYFFDTGVQRSISGKLLSELMSKTFDYGKAFEHFIICEILRLADYGKKDYQFSFYHTEAGAEVDLIVESPAGKIYALEIKSSDSPDPSGYRGLKSFAEVCPKAELICVSLAPRPRKADSVTILPWMDVFGVLGL